MKTILLDPDIQRGRMIRDGLAEMGHEVTTAESAADLVARRQVEGQRLVVVSAAVLQQEGLRLAQQLRLSSGAPNCLVLAVDEGSDAASTTELLAAGADDVLPTPLRPEVLAQRVKIAEHRLKRGLRRERWFEALIALGNTVYTVTDATGVVVYSSPTLARVTGWEPHEMVGRSLFDLILPEDLPAARDVLQQVLDNPRQAVSTQMRCWNQDGSVSVLEASVSNCLEDPQIGGIIITTSDVTKQRATESALKHSEMRYRTLVETAREGIGICDADENFVFVNPALAEQLGYERSELEQIGLRELADTAWHERFRRGTADRQKGIAARYEVSLYTKQGELRHFSLSAAPLLDDSGAFAGTLGLLTDITELKRSSEKLHKSEQRYRLIAENVSDVIWTQHLPQPMDMMTDIDPVAAVALAEEIVEQAEVTYVSPSVTQMLGYSVNEAMATPNADLLTASSVEAMRDLIASGLVKEWNPAAAVDGPALLEVEFRTRDGGSCWGEAMGNLLLDERRRLVGFLAVTRNVTERKHVERALRESELRLRRLVENMPDFVILVDQDAQIQYVNRGVAGHEVEQLVGQWGFGFLAEEAHPTCKAAFEAALATGEVQTVEAKARSGYWWDCRLVPLADEKATPQVMIICTDVTEQKEAAAAVREEQDLLRQLLELHERDRKVLAFELHDGFAQQLTGAMMSLEAASMLLASSPDKAAGPLGEATRLLRESIEESRRLVGGLRPPVLDQFGVVAAVEHLVSINQGDGTEIEFVSRGGTRRMAAPLENAVFRIVQESLTNIRRHSRSERAVVDLLVSDEGVSLKIQDWGVGFQTMQTREACFGLRGIRERARLLNGRAQVISTPALGTTINVFLPLVERPPQENDADSVVPGDGDPMLPQL